MADLILRPATAADAPELGRICYDAFCGIADQHNFPHDFPSLEVAIGLASFLIGHPGVYGVVAERDGQIVGSNFLDERSQIAVLCGRLLKFSSEWADQEGRQGGRPKVSNLPHTTQIAGVGPITVDPHAQDRGVGRRLMQAVLERAAERQFPGVRLVQAGYHTRSLSLYVSLGFQVREPLACMQGPAIGATIPGRSVRPARESDVDACNQVYHRVHGHTRAGDLADAVTAGTASVVDHAGRVTGYATSLSFFGHAVGETDDDIKALIGAASSFEGPGILVPARSPLFSWCLSQGLRTVQMLTLMSVGLYNEPRGAFLPSILY